MRGGWRWMDALWGGFVFQLPVRGRLCLLRLRRPGPRLPRPIGYADQLSGRTGWADILAPAVQRLVSPLKSARRGKRRGAEGAMGACGLDGDATGASWGLWRWSGVGREPGNAGLSLLSRDKNTLALSCSQSLQPRHGAVHAALS